MPTIEVQRQVLPILGSPNQGARFYNPDCHPASHSFPDTARAPGVALPFSTA